MDLVFFLDARQMFANSICDLKTRRKLLFLLLNLDLKLRGPDVLALQSFERHT